MQGTGQQHALLPSLLDRLIDDEPDRTLEEVAMPAAVIRSIRAGIRRDLENLLNTRLYREFSLDSYPELKKSVVNYGLPDFSTVQLGSLEEHQRLRTIIEDTIRRFESRLDAVDIEIVDKTDTEDRTLYMKISAVLMVEPDPIALLFDSRIHTVDRMVRLRELRHG